MKVAEILLKSLEIRDSLKLRSGANSANPIDANLLPVLPFRTSNKIKLIVLGQDPTVKNIARRNSIEYTLNLDKAGSLKRYIMDICFELGICFESIYATNLFKYFYSKPPERTKHILQYHLDLNLELLKEELAEYPKIPIVTLGLPVLQLLGGETKQVRYYWDYNPTTKKCGGNFSLCNKKENKLGRNIYPLPHQPSIRKKFYKNNLINYLKYIKSREF